MDLLKTGLLDGNPLEVQGTTFETFPLAPLLIVPEVITPSLELNFATGKQLDSRITFSRGSSGTFINENGNVVGKTPGTTSSITPSTTAIGSQVTVTVASGSVVGWAVGQAISLIVDTDGQDDPDAGELWLLGDIVSSTLTTLTFTVTSRTATAGSATSWTLGYRGARFTHNPSTLASLGLLIEESRTNLQSFSEQFDDATWNKNNSTISANAVTSPSGVQNADTLFETTANDTHQITSNFAASLTSAQRTFSVFAKAAGRNWIRLNVFSGTNNNCYFDIQNGVVGTVAAGATAVIQAFPNGWYRCSMTVTSTISLVVVAAANADNTLAYAGNASLGIHIWGAQLEAGAFATSYIPTTSATVTRAADVATMTGTNFSSWYNQSQGTLVSDSTSLALGNLSGIFSLDDGTANNRIDLRYWSGGQYGNMFVTVSGSTQGEIIGAISPAVLQAKAAAAYKQNDFALSANGQAALTDSSGSIPTVDRLRIGQLQGAQIFSGTIARIRYYRRRLSNANLQTLTT